MTRKESLVDVNGSGQKLPSLKRGVTRGRKANIVKKVAQNILQDKELMIDKQTLKEHNQRRASQDKKLRKIQSFSDEINFSTPKRDKKFKRSLTKGKTSDNIFLKTQSDKPGTPLQMNKTHEFAKTEKGNKRQIKRGNTVNFGSVIPFGQAQKKINFNKDKSLADLSKDLNERISPIIQKSKVIDLTSSAAIISNAKIEETFEESQHNYNSVEMMNLPQMSNRKTNAIRPCDPDNMTSISSEKKVVTNLTKSNLQSGNKSSDEGTISERSDQEEIV